MTKNQKKVTSLISIIVIIIIGLFYPYINFGKLFIKLIEASSKQKINIEQKTNINNNIADDWLGEPFSYFRNLQAVSAKKYLVSTAHQLASQVGEQILASGGNAIDATIAAQMALNVVEPQSSGIGGGAFLLYFDAKSKKSHYFNGRETAPINSYSKMFLDKNDKARPFDDVVKGGLSVGTPGLLKMLKEVHDKYGKLSWEELFKPAIMIAKNGFPMDERIYVLARDIKYLKDFTGFSALYLKKDGSPKDLDTIITNPQLAKTLSIIAKKGIKPFYEGEIARDIVNVVQNSSINPGYLSLEDLKAYKVKTGNLVCGDYRKQYKICSMPLPSSGGITLLQILGILENFDLPAMKPLSVQAIHLISEASRLGYADRNKYIADIADVPVHQMLDKKYLQQRSQLIDVNKAMTKVEAGTFADFKVSFETNKNAIELPSTTHISIVDSDGNAVAMTSSIEYYFGSVLSVGGFMLNNQLTDFSFVPEINGKLVANSLQPGRQPRSSMSPTFVFDKEDNLIMVVGSPGGPRIIQFVLKAIIAHLDWGLDIQTAISMPNFVALNDVITLESRTDLKELKPILKKMGHEVEISDLISGIHAITLMENGLEGGADPRRGGAAVGR